MMESASMCKEGGMANLSFHLMPVRNSIETLEKAASRAKVDSTSLALPAALGSVGSKPGSGKSGKAPLALGFGISVGRVHREGLGSDPGVGDP